MFSSLRRHQLASHFASFENCARYLKIENAKNEQRQHELSDDGGYVLVEQHVEMVFTQNAAHSKLCNVATHVDASQMRTSVPSGVSGESSYAYSQ